MGWPRKNDSSRIYRDKDRKTFFTIDTEDRGFPHGYSAIANILNGPEPSLGSCMISPSYISDNFLKRMQWDELPEQWQHAFRYWFREEDGFAPESIRGFWRIGCQPTAPVSEVTS